MKFWWLFAGTVGASAILTGLARRWALSVRILDIPNERSSHAAATPRGGGLGLVINFLGVVGWFHWRSLIDLRTALALAGSGAAAALIGFLDDRCPLPARWRLLVHFAAAIWGLAWLGGFPPVLVGGAVIDFGWPGQILAVVGLVWLLNLYNFMDGIDGLAGAEAVTVGLGATLLAWRYAPGSPTLELPGLLAGSALGFLAWNWPPAKIFLGDIGSGFLGLIFGLMALQAGREQPRLLWAWAILLAAFVADATMTLFQRWRRGERLAQAHRSHAYQQAARRFGGHRPVTLAIGAINVFWLLPLAAAAASGRLGPCSSILLAYAPLLGLALWLDAGVTPRPEGKLAPGP